MIQMYMQAVRRRPIFRDLHYCRECSCQSMDAPSHRTLYQLLVVMIQLRYFLMNRIKLRLKYVSKSLAPGKLNNFDIL